MSRVGQRLKHLVKHNRVRSWTSHFETRGKRLRHILIICLGLAVASPAAAADMPMLTKAPIAPQAEPRTTWSGFYSGGNVGYGWNHAVVADTFSVPGFGTLGPTTTLTENLNGAVWGGQIGYNWQLNSLVFGLEADFNGSAQKFAEPYACDVGGAVVPGCTVFPKDRIGWFSTARGRIGYAVDRYLVYATGGAAWQSLKSDGHVTIAGAGGWDVFSTSTTRSGFTVGGGAEAALSSNWSLGLEYLYLDTGTKTTANTTLPVGLSATLGAPPTTTVYETHHLTDQIVRLKLNYRL